MLGPKADGVLVKHIEMQARGKGDKKIEIKKAFPFFISSSLLWITICYITCAWMPYFLA